MADTLQNRNPRAIGGRKTKVNIIICGEKRQRYNNLLLM